jgi:hypothetical protein
VTDLSHLPDSHATDYNHHSQAGEQTETVQHNNCTTHQQGVPTKVVAIRESMLMLTMLTLRDVFRQAATPKSASTTSPSAASKMLSA